MAKLIGQSLGRYHILEQLGEGGMATVYKAYDTRLETEVAVKVIRTENLPQNTVTRALKRFEQEAKALARLAHPNIIPIIDYGEHKSQPYLVMQYIPGGTLKDVLKSGVLNYQKATQLLLPIARGLDYAHRQNMIHRDVKPSNILITEDGEPMLTDERSDIYGLGIVFYEMITGRKPYQADTPAALIFKQVTDPLPRPSTFKPDLPDVVEGVLLKALAKDSNNRYQSMKEFAVALAELTTGSPPKKKAEHHSCHCQGALSQSLKSVWIRFRQYLRNRPIPEAIPLDNRVRLGCNYGTTYSWSQTEATQLPSGLTRVSSFGCLLFSK